MNKKNDYTNNILTTNIFKSESYNDRKKKVSIAIANVINKRLSPLSLESIKWFYII